MYLAQGKSLKALQRYQEAIILAIPDSVAFASALSGLETVYESPEEFCVFCDRFREAHINVDAPGCVPSRFVQWFLAPAEARGFPRNLVQDAFAGSLSSDWTRHDPLGDCSFARGNGLEVYAASGCNL